MKVNQSVISRTEALFKRVRVYWETKPGRPILAREWVARAAAFSIKWQEEIGINYEDDVEHGSIMLAIISYIENRLN